MRRMWTFQMAVVLFLTAATWKVMAQPVQDLTFSVTERVEPRTLLTVKPNGDLKWHASKNDVAKEFLKAMRARDKEIEDLKIVNTGLQVQAKLMSAIIEKQRVELAVLNKTPIISKNEAAQIDEAVKVKP